MLSTGKKFSAAFSIVLFLTHFIALYCVTYLHGLVYTLYILTVGSVSSLKRIKKLYDITFYMIANDVTGYKKFYMQNILN